MHYLIDGYNLLFRSLRGSEDDFKQLRENFVKRLAEQIARARLSVTLVFDSHHIEGLGDRGAKETILIHFTDHKETADEYILGMVKKSLNPKEITVVTSDSRLAWASRGKGSFSMPVEEFRMMLAKKEIKEERKGKPLKEEITKNIEQKKPLKIKDKRAKTDQERWEEAFMKGEAETDQERKMASLDLRDEVIRKEGLMTDKERWLRAFEREVEE